MNNQNNNPNNQNNNGNQNPPNNYNQQYQNPYYNQGNPNNYQQQQNPYYNNNYQQPQQPQHNQMPGMFQSNQMGMQIKNEKRGFNFNIKYLIAIIIILGLIVGGYFVYKNFSTTKYEDLSLNDQITAALMLKAETVVDSNDKNRINFLNTYLSIYEMIDNPDTNNLGVNNNINSFNIAVVQSIDLISQLSGTEKENASKVFNKSMTEALSYVTTAKKAIQYSINNQLPSMKATTSSEKTAYSQLQAGLYGYIDFLTAYETYLKTPSDKSLSTANEKQNKAMNLMHKSILDYIQPD